MAATIDMKTTISALLRERTVDLLHRGGEPRIRLGNLLFVPQISECVEKVRRLHQLIDCRAENPLLVGRKLALLRIKSERDILCLKRRHVDRRERSAIDE